MRKGITPIIAIIVLLLITVALAGAAWTYLSVYMTGLTGASVELQDYFCINSDTAVILVRNTGTVDMPVGDISIINMSDGSITDGNWADAGGNPISEIGVGKTGTWTAQTTCASVDECTFRVTGGTARAQQARVFC
ncbi:MAG: hypothetical protein JSV63_00650 [Candidatus Aenigmatarchaeota archaeon]|nr:MAG: hypothetical protein JSV63_00650 [Candidatus Aenigmarchaeota archaeon]